MAEQKQEFRVTWQRTGLRRRHRLYATRKGAERWASVLAGQMVAEDPNGYACCSGWECGCGGITNAQADEQRYGKVPTLVYGPVVEARDVGEWVPS